MLQSMGSQRVRHDLATEQQQKGREGKPVKSEESHREVGVTGAKER